MAILKLTLKELVQSVEMGAIAKLVKASNLPRSTKFMIDPVWEQVQKKYEKYTEQVQEIGDTTGVRKLVPTEQDPNREMFIFETIENKRRNEALIKELLSAELSLVGDKITLDQLKFTLDPGDPLDTDDYGKLAWLIDRPRDIPTEEEALKDGNLLGID